MKTIVVYFSRNGENYYNGSIQNIKVGNAQKIVNIIKEHKEVDEFEVKPLKPYSADYHTCTIEAKNEKNSHARPEIVGNYDLSNYDHIILVYPSWWSTMPMCMFTYLDSQDLTNKHIYPICTHEGSGMGSSVNDLKKYYNEANIHNSLAVQGTYVESSTSKIIEYIKEI